MSLRHVLLAQFAGTLLSMCLVGCGGSNSSGMPDFLKPLFPPSPSEAARDAFNVYDADKRRRAINLLANSSFGGGDQYLRSYRLLIDDPDPTVRAACVAALARHGVPEDVPMLLRYIANDSPVVRWEVARALQRLHHADAVDPLIRALAGDEEADVRIAAANALGQYRQQRVFDALIGALSDNDYAVVVEAVSSLQLMTGQQHGENGRAWLKWAQQTENLFEFGKPYYYHGYQKPRSLLERAKFWAPPDTPAPKRPRGIGAGDLTPPL